MEFARAKAVGDEGERLVADALERIAPSYGLQVLNNVLLKGGHEIAQIDHIAVDRYGVLIVESKVRRGALIRGRDVEHRWTACYPKKKTETFQNPLQQNDQHAAVLRRVLQAAGRPLDPNYVRSVVVFAGANTSQLELDDLNRSRVIDVADVERFIKDRHDFAPNSGVLTPHAVSALAEMIRGLDQSDNDEVVAAHGARVRRRGRRKRAEEEPVVWREAGFASRMEDLSEIRRIGRRFRRRNGLLARLAQALVGGIVGFSLLWYFFLGPGWDKISNVFTLGGAPTVPATPAAAPTAAPSVAEAKAALAEAAPPEIIAGLVKPDEPVVTSVPQGTTFTWEFVQAGGNAATVRMIAITLDANRQIVGVDIR